MHQITYNKLKAGGNNKGDRMDRMDMWSVFKQLGIKETAVLDKM